MDARPGGGPCSRLAVATTAPPTGTKKFLSVDWTKASSLAWREAVAMAFMHAAHCTPYALLARCGTSAPAHNRATSSSFSIPRGAKHEVVESTHSTLDAPTSANRAASAGTSVRSSSPSSTFSTGTGVSPAARMALRHDFWSIRGHKTRVAPGRIWRSAISSKVTDMPVASGSVTVSLTPVPPARRSASAANALVSA
eukprot:scaffold2182_cov118-Isochrysis_galbana.AAC.7